MSDPSGILSPSTHVQLLQQYQLAQDAKNTLALPGDDLTLIHTLAPTPRPEPSPQPQHGGMPVDPAAAIPLPPAWAALRAQQLRLPCERRFLPDLRIDTTDPHLLRRGLWLACASMFLPNMLKVEAELAGAADASAADVNMSTGGNESGSESGAVVPVRELECVGDVRVPSIFEVSVVTGGITNQLYRAALKTHPEQPVLVRIYGPRTELVIDRSKENDVVDVLSLTGEGPRIYGRFSNGRLESWLVGRSMTPAEMRDPALSPLIARTLSRLHRQPMPFPREPVIAGVLRKWAAIAADVRFDEAPAKAAQLTRLDLPRVLAATEQYISHVYASHFGASSSLVFAHNDLLSGNVMLDPVHHRVALVDFEYGNFNPRGFDLANHFIEWGGFECQWEHCPTFEEQQRFIRAYLQASMEQEQQQEVAGAATTTAAAALSTATASAAPTSAVAPPSSSAAAFQRSVDRLYAEVQVWLLAPHLFWCLWAVVQARYSPISFDYLSYAGQRWRAFQDMKAHSDRWSAVTDDTLDEAIEQQRTTNARW